MNAWSMANNEEDLLVKFLKISHRNMLAGKSYSQEEAERFLDDRLLSEKTMLERMGYFIWFPFMFLKSRLHTQFINVNIIRTEASQKKILALAEKNLNAEMKNP